MSVNLENTHILTPEAIRPFILAGKALFTVLNTETGNRFTFRVRQKEDSNDGFTPHFVQVLTGPDNTSNFTYIGCIFDSKTFRWTKKSGISHDAPSVKAFYWLWKNADKLPANVEVRHHNRCGRCNRVLTVPESIDRGLGVICAGYSQDSL